MAFSGESRHVQDVLRKMGASDEPSRKRKREEKPSTESEGKGDDSEGIFDRKETVPRYLPQTTLHFCVRSVFMDEMESGKMYIDPLHTTPTWFFEGYSFGNHPANKLFEWLSAVPQSVEHLKFVSPFKVCNSNFQMLSDALSTLGGTPITTTAFSPTAYIEKITPGRILEQNKWFQVNKNTFGAPTPISFPTSLITDQDIIEGKGAGQMVAAHARQNNSLIGDIDTDNMTIDYLRESGQNIYTLNRNIREALDSPNQGWYVCGDLKNVALSTQEVGESRLRNGSTIINLGENAVDEYEIPTPRGAFAQDWIIRKEKPPGGDNNFIIATWPDAHHPAYDRAKNLGQLGDGDLAAPRDYDNDKAYPMSRTSMYAFPNIKGADNSPLKFRAAYKREVEVWMEMHMDSRVAPSIPWTGEFQHRSIMPMIRINGSVGAPNLARLDYVRG